MNIRAHEFSIAGPLTFLHVDCLTLNICACTVMHQVHLQLSRGSSGSATWMGVLSEFAAKLTSDKGDGQYCFLIEA